MHGPILVDKRPVMPGEMRAALDPHRTATLLRLFYKREVQAFRKD